MAFDDRRPMEDDRGPPRRREGGGDRGGGERGGERGGGERGGRGGRGGGRFGRRKVCRFCVEKARYVDWKEVRVLRGFLTDQAKILPRRTTGTCSKHQRQLTVAIKRARQIALLPISPE